MRHTYINVKIYEAQGPLWVRGIARRSKFVKLPDNDSINMISHIFCVILNGKAAQHPGGVSRRQPRHEGNTHHADLSAGKLFASLIHLVNLSSQGIIYFY